MEVDAERGVEISHRPEGVACEVGEVHVVDIAPREGRFRPGHVLGQLTRRDHTLSIDPADGVWTARYRNGAGVTLDQEGRIMPSMRAPAGE